MYSPAHYVEAEETWLREIIDQHPFATLITAGEVTHVPLLLEERGGEWFLIGHLARANPHWKALEKAPSLAIFHGPHAYVSPTWYEHCDVPTWNYLVVHLEGSARLLESAPEVEEVVQKLSARTEGPNGWKFEVPADLAGRLEKAIVGFEIRVTRRTGKFKLSQNKTAADRAGVVHGLEARGGAQDHAVAGWMRRLAERVEK